MYIYVCGYAIIYIDVIWDFQALCGGGQGHQVDMVLDEGLGTPGSRASSAIMMTWFAWVWVCHTHKKDLTHQLQGDLMDLFE